MRRWRGLSGALLTVADAAALLGLRAMPGEVVRRARAPHAWLADAGPDRVLAVLAAAGVWLVAAWVALGLAGLALAAAPGAAGAAGRRIATVLLPRVLLRLVAGSAGLGLLLAPAIPAAATAAGQPPGTARALPALTAPCWPTSAAALPGPVWPDTAATGPARNGGTTIRVRPGDSLWLLAAQRLGPSATDTEIARAWPAWYAANRTVIGDDPGLLLPGQALHVPTTPAPEPS